MSFAKGNLADLVNACNLHATPSSSNLEFWQQKFDAFKNLKKAKTWNWDNFSLADFLSKITFEKQSESSLKNEAHHLLISNCHITSGNEQQYFIALYCLVVDKSRQKQEIRYTDFVSCIERVKEDIAKGPMNPAVQGKWLDCVVFDAGIEAESSSSYFEGKAARPTHIAAGLPVRRKRWEENVLQRFHESDVVVIRASSGQGKSTLAWQLAFDLQAEGWTPFELQWCRDEEQTGNIITLVESQVKVGKFPLIVVDGLRREVSAWNNLVKRTLDLPVKYIVTAREEDWWRFGADRSQFRLSVIDIKINKEEAEQIFYLFKKARKIHPSVGSWQSSWEKIADRGLLIEYVYLLTQGAMLEERLSYQINQLSTEPDGKSKLEILRLVAVADLCGVRLATSSLISYIESGIGFAGDRGQCLKSLEKEYYLQIEDREYVEGLHPIRSEYIAKILHETLPLHKTLLNLLPLIETDAVFDFSAYAPLLVRGKQRTFLLNQLAKYFANKSYRDIVNVIDGLFSTDALQHWKENQSIYDNIFARGAGFFAIYAFPWIGLNINDFADAGLKPFIETISPMINEIKKNIDPKKFDTCIFIQALSNAFTKTTLKHDLSGFGRLAFWYNKFEVDFPLFLNIDESQLWDAFQLLELEDSGELFSACYVIRPEVYKAFFDRHRPEIIGMLKVRTNTLTISEDNSDLLIEYFIEFESDSSINEQSVSRIDLIKAFLHPQYKTYSTQGLYPVIQGIDAYSGFDESKKHIQLKSLPRSFDVRVNRIWENRIDANYQNPSVYEWQKQWYEIRSKSLQLAIEYIGLFEARLKQDKATHNKSINKLRKLSNFIIKNFDSRKDFPSRVKKEFDSEAFKNEFQTLSQWASCWRRFIEQPQTSGQDQHSYLTRLCFSIQDTYKNLDSMQNAYDKIEAATSSYFNVSSLKHREKEAYSYLLKLINFVSKSDKIGKITDPKAAVNKWWYQLDTSRVEKISEILSNVEKDSKIRCTNLLYTLERDFVREAAIGVKGSKHTNDVLLEPFIRSLCDLADIDIDYYYLLFINDKNYSQPFAIRLTKNCLQHVKEFKGTSKEFQWDNRDKPLLAPLKEDVLRSLPEISVRKMDMNIMYLGEKIISNLWRITEVRRRLSPNVKVERAWLTELVDNYCLELGHSLSCLKDKAPQQTWKGYKNLAEAVVSADEPLTLNLLQRHVAV
jgi:hypothetical protein